MKKGFLSYIIVFLILTIPLTLFLHLYYSYLTDPILFSFSFWNINLLLSFEISIITLGLVWLLYSKILSKLLNLDFKEALKKDLFTYSPFLLLLLCYFRLAYYSNGWVSSYRLLLLTILLIIILKVATILQIKKKFLGAYLLVALVIILPLSAINYFIINNFSVTKEKYVKPNFSEILKHECNADPSSFFSGNLTGIEKKKIRINNEIRNSLVLLPPKRVETTVTIPAKPFLQFGFGVWEETYSGIGDGVHINLFVKNKNKIKKIYSRYIDPKHNEKERRWFDVEIDLKDYAKQEVSIIFEALGSPEIHPPFNNKRKADNRDDYLIISNPYIRSKIEKDRTDYNIILISLDTLRADHLGCYGYRRKDISPNIDRMAGNGILFKNAISQTSWTVPSHMSMFTSFLPSYHGVNGSISEFNAISRGNKKIFFRTLPEDIITLAEYFKSNGYLTVAYTGGAPMRADIGFGQGFDRYFEKESDSFASNSVFNELTEWLEINKKQSFFLFLHTFRVHSPYKHLTYASELLTKTDIAKLENHFDQFGKISFGEHNTKRVFQELGLWKKEVNEILYEGGITETDKYIGKLMKELKRLNLLSKTIIVLTSDHGEEFGDHNKNKFYCGHGRTLYDEVIRVPLIFVVPGNFPKGKRIDYQVRLIDIMPTLLDLAKIKSDTIKDLQGVSLLPLLKGKKPEADELVAISELNLWRGKYRRSMKAIRTNNFKYIYTSCRKGAMAEQKLSYDKPFRQELYDLINDSGEKVNIFPYEPELSRSSKNAIKNTLKGAVKKLSNEKKVMTDKETTKRLKALGYIQ